jgi:hypothetical protein
MKPGTIIMCTGHVVCNNNKKGKLMKVFKIMFLILSFLTVQVSVISAAACLSPEKPLRIAGKK